MLRAATVARGPKTAVKLTLYYCPMVPGGADWMQPGGDLANPYWGSEMLVHPTQAYADLRIEVFQGMAPVSHDWMKNRPR